MKIRTINYSDLCINKNTQYGKKRLEIIQNMIDKGCQVIRECEKPDSCVYLGYMNKYVRLANYAAKVNKDGSYQEKYTRGMYSPLPSSMKTFYLKKVNYDKDGNADTLERTIRITNSKVILEEEITDRKNEMRRRKLCKLR